MIDKGQCSFYRAAEGREIAFVRGEGRRDERGTGNEERGALRLSASLDKEAPSMQIKCCFHNHSSVPLSEVRFFVIKVKGTFTRDRAFARSLRPTNQLTNQPPTRPPHARPQATLLISITENSKHVPLYDTNKKIRERKRGGRNIV